MDGPWAYQPIRLASPGCWGVESARAPRVVDGWYYAAFSLFRHAIIDCWADMEGRRTQFDTLSMPKIRFV